MDIEFEIANYKSLVLQFYKLITKHYKISEKDFVIDPYRFIKDRPIPTKGSFIADGIKYSFFFHGGGCDIDRSDGLNVRFNFAPLDTLNIKTSPWKFYMFLQSKYATSIIDEKDIFEQIESLCVEGIIIFKTPHGSYVIA